MPCEHRFDSYIAVAAVTCTTLQFTCTTLRSTCTTLQFTAMIVRLTCRGCVCSAVVSGGGLDANLLFVMPAAIGQACDPAHGLRMMPEGLRPTRIRVDTAAITCACSIYIEYLY
jgi:hypothetical protein